MTLTHTIRTRAPQVTIVADGAERYAVVGDAEEIADQLNALSDEDSDAYSHWCNTTPVADIALGFYPDTAHAGASGARACEILLACGAGEVYYDQPDRRWRAA